MNYINVMLPGLTNSQRLKVSSAIYNSVGFTLFFTYNQLLETSPKSLDLFITERQKLKISKNLAKKKGIMLQISNRLLKYNLKHGTLDLITNKEYTGTSIISNHKFGETSSTQLEQIMKFAGNDFLGVFPNEPIFKKLTTNQCFITNFDKPSGNGTHWVCAFTGNNANFYFDSYGGSIPENIYKLLKGNGKTIIANSLQLQANNSSLCGYFCVDCLHYLRHGGDFQDFIGLFNPTNLQHNDQIVKDYYINHLH
jgi:hypothetical protein